MLFFLLLWLYSKVHSDAMRNVKNLCRARGSKKYAMYRLNNRGPRKDGEQDPMLPPGGGGGSTAV